MLCCTQRRSRRCRHFVVVPSSQETFEKVERVARAVSGDHVARPLNGEKGEREASSFVLLVIARDLSRMQVVAVTEAAA